MQTLKRMYDRTGYWTLIQLVADSWPEHSANAVGRVLCRRTKVHLDRRDV